MAPVGTTPQLGQTGRVGEMATLLTRRFRVLIGETPSTTFEIDWLSITSIRFLVHSVALLAPHWAGGNTVESGRSRVALTGNPIAGPRPVWSEPIQLLAGVLLTTSILVSASTREGIITLTGLKTTGLTQLSHASMAAAAPLGRMDGERHCLD